ncbi:MAG: hypothetical protein HY648_13945 [Acidobacteria bacterium]|nr:hypothetical protein [Acidobacteriota bacterium]
MMSSTPTPRPGLLLQNPLARIGIELLTKAALCAGIIGLVAGMVAALFFNA